MRFILLFGVCFDSLLLMAEGKVAYLGSAKGAVPFFNQYVVERSDIVLQTYCCALNFYHNPQLGLQGCSGCMLLALES